MNIKVQWKKEVIKRLRDGWLRGNEWYSISMFDGSQTYRKDFDVEYFIIDDETYFTNYTRILYPNSLNRWMICRKHVEEYVPSAQYKFEIDDGLFEL